MSSSSVRRPEVVVMEYSSRDGFHGRFEAFGYSWLVTVRQVPETSYVDFGIKYDAAVPNWTRELYENLRRDTYTVTVGVLNQIGAPVDGMTKTFTFKGSNGGVFEGNFCTVERLRDFVLTREFNRGGHVHSLRLLFEVQRSCGNGENGSGIFAGPAPPHVATPRRLNTMNSFNDSDFSDFTIRVGSRDFHVHGMIVATCPYFRTSRVKSLIDGIEQFVSQLTHSDFDGVSCICQGSSGGVRTRLRSSVGNPAEAGSGQFKKEKQE